MLSASLLDREPASTIADQSLYDGLSANAYTALTNISGEISERDRAFFTETYTAALHSAQYLKGYGHTLIHLLDLDGTVSVESDNEALEYAEPRPCMTLLLETIATDVTAMGVNYKIGVLSDHAQSELNGPTFAHDYNFPEHLIDTNFLISSRDNPIFTEVIEAWRAAYRSHDPDVDIIYEDPKIAILDILGKQNPAYDLLITDDRASIAGITSQNVHGHLLDEKANGWPEPQL